MARLLTALSQIVYRLVTEQQRIRLLIINRRKTLKLQLGYICLLTRSLCTLTQLFKTNAIHRPIRILIDFVCLIQV